MYSVQSNFPCLLEDTPTGRVRLTLEMEHAEVKTFLSLLESLSGFFRIINNKARASAAKARSEVLLKDGDYQFQIFAAAVEDTFLTIKADTDLPPHRLISAVNAELKIRFPFSSYESVKQVLRHSGHLRKCGFYSHK